MRRGMGRGRIPVRFDEGVSGSGCPAGLEACETADLEICVTSVGLRWDLEEPMTASLVRQGTVCDNVVVREMSCPGRRFLLCGKASVHLGSIEIRHVRFRSVADVTGVIRSTTE
jgi:hypothetical protein